jgi:hypothetical protein
MLLRFAEELLRLLDSATLQVVSLFDVFHSQLVGRDERLRSASSFMQLHRPSSSPDLLSSLGPLGRVQKW